MTSSQSRNPFDEEPESYDRWFTSNPNVLESELRLLAHFLGRRDPGRALSVGCGSGLFELRLREEFGIRIGECVEPSEMGRIASGRGLRVTRGTAESLPFGDSEFDTVLMNGVLDYVPDPAGALSEAHRVLRRGGWIVVADVAAEGSYGLLYRLAAIVGWEELRDLSPANPYPIEMVSSARWHTSEEIGALLRGAGFTDLEFAQTLTRHPRYSDEAPEDPVPGHDRGDYVAVRGVR
ncbi:MAG: class I SAM-dependent methyltransferase [Conexivisphaera sp.]